MHQRLNALLKESTHDCLYIFEYTRIETCEEWRVGWQKDSLASLNRQYYVLLEGLGRVKLIAIGQHHATGEGDNTVRDDIVHGIQVKDTMVEH